MLFFMKIQKKQSLRPKFTTGWLASVVVTWTTIPMNLWHITSHTDILFVIWLSSHISTTGLVRELQRMWLFTQCTTICSLWESNHLSNINIGYVRVMDFSQIFKKFIAVQDKGVKKNQFSNIDLFPIQNNKLSNKIAIMVTTAPTLSLLTELSATVWHHSFVWWMQLQHLVHWHSC